MAARITVVSAVANAASATVNAASAVVFAQLLKKEYVQFVAECGVPCSAWEGMMMHALSVCLAAAERMVYILSEDIQVWSDRFDLTGLEDILWRIYSFTEQAEFELLPELTAWQQRAAKQVTCRYMRAGHVWNVEELAVKICERIQQLNGGDVPIQAAVRWLMS